MSDSQLDEKTLTVTDPPYTLVLRRTGFRIFPNGERVALYYSPKLKKTFSVPYNTKHDAIISVAEETEFLEESVVHQLHGIIRQNQDREVRFQNNSRTKVSVTTAEKVLGLYYQLNSSNKQEMSKLVNSNPENFSKAASFAKKNIT